MGSNQHLLVVCWVLLSRNPTYDDHQVIDFSFLSWCSESNEYGVHISRKVELSGGEKPGAIVVRYFYPQGDLNAIPQVTSIVPLVYQ